MNTSTKNELTMNESSVSCDQCRKRKKRCGRELPRCKGCVKRGLECGYPNIAHKRKSKSLVFPSFQNKLEFKNNLRIRSHNIPNESSTDDIENLYNKQHDKMIIYQAISSSNSDSKVDVSNSLYFPSSSKQSQKFENHLILILTTQIIQYDQNIIPAIDLFVDKMHFAIYGLTKTKFGINQEWIQELLQPDFKSKLIDNYFAYFHPSVTYISKFYFFNNIDKIHPALMSVILFVGYTIFRKQHPELRKYLKHCAMIQLKKNMFNVNVGVCQALYIFSYWMLLHGLAKQSISYFNQACLMSSALGMYVDMPNISPEEQHQRHCIRGYAINNDTHMASTLSTQPYFLFLTPSAKILDPIYQMNPYSTDPYERLKAECISTMRYCYDRYWIPVIHLMLVSPILISNKPNYYQSKDFKMKAQYFNKLYDYAIIDTLAKYLDLSNRYQLQEEFRIINNGVSLFCVLYYHLDLVLYSHLPPTVDPKTGCLNSGTVKSVQAATAICNIASSHPDSFIYIYYHYLFGISLFYIKLIISLYPHPDIQSKLIEKFQQPFKLLKIAKQYYKVTDDILEVTESMANFFKIPLQ